MATGTASGLLDHFLISVSVQGRAVDLTEDARRALDAVRSWLSGKDYRSIGDITAARVVYAAAIEGDTDASAEETPYGQLIARATEIATHAATSRWAVPDAFVTVNIEAA